jgi:hypothetical protein
MKLRKNIFTSDLVLLLDRLTDLTHTLHLNDWIARNMVESSKKAFSQLKTIASKGPFGYFHAGTALPIIDLFHRDKLVRRSPYGVRSTSDRRLVKAPFELSRRFNALVIVEAHELMERFVRDVYGRLLFLVRETHRLKSLDRFHARHPKAVQIRGTPQYFVQYATWTCDHSSVNALNELLRMVDWKAVHLKYIGKMSLPLFVRAIGVCRHAIVHASGKVTENEMRRLDKAQRRYIDSLQKRSIFTNERLILPDRRTADRVLEVFASMAFAIYRLLALRFDLKLERSLPTWSESVIRVR